MNGKYTPSECVTDFVAGVNEKRDATSRSLTSHYETTSEWLAEAIQTCKRKILEGTGHEVTESKRMKPTTASDKENVVESIENSKMSAQTKLLKKAISTASVKKAVPASVQKSAASKFDTHPSYLRIMSLKVSDLRVQLRQRGLDTTGLKKELQNRLLKDVEGVSKPQDCKNASKSAALLETAERAVDGGTDVEMTDASKDPNDAKMEVCAEAVPSSNESMTDVTAMSVSGNQATASEDRAKVPEPDVKETTVGKSFLRSTAELFSPGRIASKIMLLKQDADVAEPSLVVPCETKQKPDAIQPLRNSLADSVKKTASAIMSASAIGKGKTVQCSKSPFPKEKSAMAPDAVNVVVDVVDLTETMSSLAQQKQPESSSKPQSQLLPSKPVASVPSKLSNPGAATKEKRSKAAADRMARLAEIRGKSKPVAGSKSVAANDLPALSASKRLQISSAKDSKSDRKGLLTAQMREKAAAGLKMQKSSKVLAPPEAIPASKAIVSQQKQAKAQESVAPVATQQTQEMTKETVPSVVSQPKQTAALESVAPVASQQTQAKTKETVSSVVSQQKQAKGQESVAAVASKQTQAKTKETVSSVVSQQNAKENVALVPKITASPKVVIAKKLAASTPSAASRSVSKMMASSAKKAAPRPDILSPMSTYEISDREQSDTDDSDSECDQKRKKKKVPSWAQRSNLLPALELQYANKDGRLDPETIFPPVSSCNLEEIFNQKKSRYNRRTSSANWSKDGVTVHEIVNYKRTMGY